MKSSDSLITNKNGNPIKILEIGKHTCIRVIRQAVALKSVGYEVDCLSGKLSYGTDIFDKLYFFHNEQQFKNHLADLKGKYDIIHVHNEPDEMVTWAKDVIQDKAKIVHDVHDADIIRRGYIPVPERLAFNNADAVIYVSEPIQKKCNDIHKVTVPNMILYNYPTQSMITNTKVPWDKVALRRGMVYEGGVNPIGDTEEIRQMNIVFKYRDLFPIFQQLIMQGNEVHAYPGNSDAYNTGQFSGVVLHPPTRFDILLQELVQFKYNLLIFNNEDKKQDQVNYTTPNKLWDGLAAGLPSLACWCEETEKYVVKHNIGWRFDSIKDVGNCSSIDPEYMEKVGEVRKKREELIFEKQVGLLENLYAQILGVQKKDIPASFKKQLEFEYGNEAVFRLLKESE